MIAGDVARLWDAPTTEEDTHPSPVERIKLLERLRRGESPGQEKEGCAIAPARWQTVSDLFGEPGRWQADQQQRQATAAKDQAEARREYFDNVIAHIDAYLAENPGLSVPVRDRAGVRLKMHDYAGAVVDFTEAIRLEAPEQGLCHLGRGIALARLGKLDDAASDLREAMRLDPSLESEKADGRIELGAVLFRAGQASAAIGEFTRAIELEPDRLSILLRRADAYASQGDFTAALEDYATVLQRDPRCAEALAGRSRVRQAQGEIRARRDRLPRRARHRTVAGGDTAGAPRATACLPGELDWSRLSHWLRFFDSEVQASAFKSMAVRGLRRSFRWVRSLTFGFSPTADSPPSRFLASRERSSNQKDRLGRSTPPIATNRTSPTARPLALDDSNDFRRLLCDLDSTPDWVRSSGRHRG